MRIYNILTDNEPVILPGLSVAQNAGLPLVSEITLPSAPRFTQEPNGNAIPAKPIAPVLRKLRRFIVQCLSEGMR